MKRDEQTPKTKSKSQPLGRGLGTLFGDSLLPIDGDEIVRQISIDLVDNDPLQPRRSFDEEKLNELAQSIQQHGIMQPLVVTDSGDRFRIIAGERRYRAARIAGLDTLPVVVMKDKSPGESLQLALIENIQREDLNPMEHAEALNRLVHEYGLTQQQIAAQIGKPRSSVANLMRLTSLPKEVREMIADGSLTTGHAKALMTIADPDILVETATTVVRSGMSVRQTEDLVKSITEQRESAKKPEAETKPSVKPRRSPFPEAQAQLTEALGTNVRIAGNEKKGKITIEYASKEQLEQFFEYLKSMHPEE